MIKIFGIVMAIGGAIALGIGVMEIFGSMQVWVSPWVLSILGFIFFISVISLLKYRKDTDVIQTENRG